MSSLITLDALKVLDTIDTKGSFSSAAETLYKVPSALTYTMKRLEMDLKVKLFDRSGQRAVLTPAGLLVLSQGREILAAAMQLEEAVHQLSTGWESKLVIAKDTVLCELPLLKEVGEFTQLGKQVSISILDESLGGGWDALHSGRADIAVGVIEDLPKGEYQLQPIGLMEFVFAVAAEHPLASKSIITHDDLLHYPSVVVADTSITLAERSSGIFDSRQVIRVQSMASKIRAQQLGIGVGFLPKHLITTELASSSLVVCATELERHSQPLFIAWRRKEEGKALHWFVKRLTQLDWGLSPNQ